MIASFDIIRASESSHKQNKSACRAQSKNKSGVETLLFAYWYTHKSRGKRIRIKCHTDIKINLIKG